jgi:hypothetical protein
VDLLLQAWWCLQENKPFAEGFPSEDERRTGWKEGIAGRNVELGWLARQGDRPARYEALDPDQFGL